MRWTVCDGDYPRGQENWRYKGHKGLLNGYSEGSLPKCIREFIRLRDDVECLRHIEQKRTLESTPS